jgi:hypothetical protein
VQRDSDSLGMEETRDGPPFALSSHRGLFLSRAEVMSAKQMAWMDELSSFYEIALFELPSAAAKLMLDGDDQRFRAAGWKAYDSWVRLANETANRLYSNPAFSAAAGRTFEAALTLRRLNSVLVSGAVATFWPALDLPNPMRMTGEQISVEAIVSRQAPTSSSAEYGVNGARILNAKQLREIPHATGGRRTTRAENSLSMKAA